jgi:hypothetical protein
MTAALLEDEVRQQQNELVKAFTMPKACRGQAVTWYPSGAKSSAAETAFVLEVGKRNVVLQRASGLAIASVRHIDDPKLQLSAEQRESGAWDFTDEAKQMLELQKIVKETAEKVRLLEEMFNEPKEKKQ